jgi:hypothetical protein
MLLIRDRNVVAWGQDNADIMFYVVNMEDYTDQEVYLSPTTKITTTGLEGYATQGYVDNAIASIEIPEGSSSFGTVDTLCLNLVETHTSGTYDTNVPATAEQIEVLEKIYANPTQPIYVQMTDSLRDIIVNSSKNEANNRITLETAPWQNSSGYFVTYYYVCHKLGDGGWTVKRTSRDCNAVWSEAATVGGKSIEQILAPYIERIEALEEKTAGM